MKVMIYCKKLFWRRGGILAIFVIVIYLAIEILTFQGNKEHFLSYFDFKQQNYASRFLRKGEAKDKLIKCENSPIPSPSIGQRGSFWVLYNHVTATKHFACDESITYTTNADMTFLDNLGVIVDRWRGPVSIAIYTPGTDYAEALKRIKYLRECIPGIKDFVTFHLFFDTKYMPVSIEDTLSHSFTTTVPSNDNSYCKDQAGLLKFDSSVQTFRRSQGLLYPVNVARNLARDMATTHYVFASDIELYPSPGFIPQFLEMLQREGTQNEGGTPRVYVLPLFELQKTVNISNLPGTKKELVELFESGMAVNFHNSICARCHKVPEQDRWLTHPISPGLHVFVLGKRQGEQREWEPFYVGTRRDPAWDERLTWEGRSNKMTQNYILCLLDYDLLVLDNAFLVHRPGIKKRNAAALQNSNVGKTDNLIRKTIRKEIEILYGKRQGCFLK